ncbi:MAG: putative endonuclease [Anaerophaga sp.]|nr:putative endonuclease [Anaerophaga sp.]
MYILECADGSYYTGSTKNLELRLAQHQAGEGANHTKKHLPVKLVYYEEFQRIDEAFYREKQVQGWSRKKKEALIAGMPEQLHQLAECLNETHYKNYNAVTEESNNTVAERSRSTATGGFGSAQPPEDGNNPSSPRCLSEVEGSGLEDSIQ